MDVFYALAEPTRRNIIEILAADGQLSASALYRRFKVSPQAISQHLKVLRDTKLVRVEKRAQQRIYSVNPPALLELDEWIKQMTHQWDSRFEALDMVLQDEKSKLSKEAKND